METILSEIENFDIYETSKEYTKSSLKKGSCKSRNYWNKGYSLSVNDIFGDEFRSDCGVKVSKEAHEFVVSYVNVLNIENSIISPIKNNKKQEILIKDKIFFISNQLSEIADEIKCSAEILDYDSNWDYDNAEPVSPVLYIAGVNFLISYSEYIFKKLGVIIQSPEINAGRNGNIYLAWRTENARLGISIEENKGEVLAVYYGDLGNNRNVIKGNVSVINVEDYLAYWMKYLV